MIADVTGSSSEFKILKPVVVLDAVNVMDVFVWSESAPKMAFHDDAMLQHIEAIAGKLDVSVFPNASRNVSIATRARAEAHTTSDPFRLDGELLSASLADDNDSHTKPPSA